MATRTTEDGRPASVVPIVIKQDAYVVHCFSRERDEWVVVNAANKVVLSVFPEDGVLTQQRAAWYANNLNDLEE